MKKDLFDDVTGSPTPDFDRIGKWSFSIENPRNPRNPRLINPPFEEDFVQEYDITKDLEEL